MKQKSIFFCMLIVIVLYNINLFSRFNPSKPPPLPHKIRVLFVRFTTVPINEYMSNKHWVRHHLFSLICQFNIFLSVTFISEQLILFFFFISSASPPLRFKGYRCESCMTGGLLKLVLVLLVYCWVWDLPTGRRN